MNRSSAPEDDRGERLKERVAALERDLAAAEETRLAREQARARAMGVDRLIATVLSEALAQPSLPGIAERGRPSREAGLALVAVGGYGRAELSPKSDVDLLFVFPGSDGTKATAPRAVVEQVLYALWDSGLEIGHAARTIPECIAVGKAEVTARSSLLDHRFVAGDADLYRRFASELERKLFRVDEPGFVAAKLAEIGRRRERFGAAVSRNEPNLKEGEGGLRDAHTAAWIARAVWRTDLSGLVARNRVRPDDLAEHDAAFERLLRARAALHRLAGRKEDRLSFDRQAATAAALGFPDVEPFMQSLAQAMAAIQRFLQLVVDRAPERFHRAARDLGPRPSRPRDSSLRARAPAGFRVRRGRLTFADRAAGGTGGGPRRARSAEPSTGGGPRRARSAEPSTGGGPRRARSTEPSAVALIRLFEVAAAMRLPLHPEARETVRASRRLLAENRDRAEVVDAFWSLLLVPDGDGLERALLEMNDLGALAAVLPEFEALYCRVQHDTYHVYTCDTHLVLAAANAHRLRGGAFRAREPVLDEIAKGLPPRVLVLGSFLHDVGKSERGHTEAGLRMLPRIAAQLRLSGSEREDVHFLMEQHLLMSHVAQRRDLSDPETIAGFAAKVGTIERLRLLYALTVCDIASVGPTTYTDWKGALLRELYQRTTLLLEQGATAVRDEAKQRRAATSEAARRLLAERRRTVDAERFDRFLANLPERYFVATHPESVVDDFLLGELPSATGLRVQARVVGGGRATEITFQAADRAGLFADLAGSLAAAGMSIRTARIHTAADGIAIDRFDVVGPDGGPVDLLAVDRMVRDLLWVLTGKQTASELIQKRSPPSYRAPRPPGKPPRVEIHNDASADSTVVDVYAIDRLGLLFDIASGLTTLGLDIGVAIVSTKVDQVADSFYVRRVGGGKVTDPAAIERLRADLLSRVG